MTSVQALQLEIQRLNEQIDKIGEARNQEVLDLQKSFAERIREMEKLNGKQFIEENEQLKQKLKEASDTIKTQHDEIIELKRQIRIHETNARDAMEREDSLTSQLEQARIAVNNYQRPTSQTDISKLIESMEEQLVTLANIIT